MHVFPRFRADHARAAVFVEYHDMVTAGFWLSGLPRPGVHGVSPRQIAVPGHGEVEIRQQCGHEVVGTDHCRLHGAFGQAPRLADQGGYPYGVLVHVQRIRPVALAPEPVVSQAETVVAQENDQGVFADAVMIEPVQQAADIEVHGRDGREVALQALPVAHVLAGQAAGPGMHGFLGTGFEGAVVVGIDDVLGMARPRAVRRGVMDAQIEGLIAVGVAVDKGQRVVGDDVRDVSRFGDRDAVPDHGGVVVGTAAELVGEPVGKSVLGERAVAQVPFPAETASPSVGRQYVGVGGLAFQVGCRAVSDVASPDPVVHAVLGGDPAGEQRRAAGRTYRRGHEETIETHPGLRDPVDMRRADFPVAVAARRPDALVVGKDKEDVRSRCRHGQAPEFRRLSCARFIRNTRRTTCVS